MKEVTGCGGGERGIEEVSRGWRRCAGWRRCGVAEGVGGSRVDGGWGEGESSAQ